MQIVGNFISTHTVWLQNARLVYAIPTSCRPYIAIDSLLYQGRMFDFWLEKYLVLFSFEDETWDAVIYQSTWIANLKIVDIHLYLNEWKINGSTQCSKNWCDDSSAQISQYGK